jgi:hypothetical protein
MHARLSKMATLTISEGLIKQGLRRPQKNKGVRGSYKPLSLQA